jgi:hypothetical protein
MKNIINGLKQIKTRVDSGTITTVNGTETLLSKQLANMLELAINYTRCCKSDSEQLFCDNCNGVKKKGTWIDKSVFSCECKNKAK